MSSGGSFDGASLTELRAMIANTDPNTLDTVAARWEAIDIALQQAQDDLLHHARAATAHWSGAAADAFSARAEQLHRSLGNGAAYASHACSGVSFAADSLRVARLAMPPEPASLEGVVAVEEAHITGTAADALHEQQRRQAVAVMERLEEKYAEAARMIGSPGIAKRSEDRGAFLPPSSLPLGTNSRSRPSKTTHLQSTYASQDPLTEVNPTGPNMGAAAAPKLDSGGSLAPAVPSSNALSPINPGAESSYIYRPEISGASFSPDSPGILARGHPPTTGLKLETAHQDVTIPAELNSTQPLPVDETRPPKAAQSDPLATTKPIRSSAGLRSRVITPRSAGLRQESQMGRVRDFGPPYDYSMRVQHENSRPSMSSADETRATPPQAVPPPSNTPATTERRGRKNRARYLTEDAATWASEKDANPPVII